MIRRDSYCCPIVFLVLSQITEKHLLFVFHFIPSPAVFVFANMNIWKDFKSRRETHQALQ